MSLASVTKSARNALRSFKIEPAKVGQLIICERSTSSTALWGPTARRGWFECGIILETDRKGVAKSYRSGQGDIHIVDHDREQTYVIRDQAKADLVWSACGGREFPTIAAFQREARAALEKAGLL